MFFLILVIIVALIVILRGGKLDNLLRCNFRHPWLVLLAVGFKIISISNLYQVIGVPGNAIPYLRTVSLFMVIIFVLLNFSLKGLPVLSLGLISNTLVVALNGGNMPANAKFAQLIASGQELDRLQSGMAVNSFILTSPDTKLSFLGDIFLMPEWIPMTRLFSIGDIFITVGAIIFITYYLRNMDFNAKKTC